MDIIYILDLIGTAAFAASGAWVGVRKHMDLFGVLVLGTVTAVGGGTLRDLLLGDIPPFSLKDEAYIYMALVVSLVVFVNRKRFEFFEKPLLYFDAIGLGTFVVIGTSKAIDFQLGALGAVLMGVMTGTMCGIFRDLLCNEEPIVFQSPLYATVSWAGSLLFIGLLYTQTDATLSAIIAGGSIFIARLLALRFNLSLPRFRFKS